MIKIWMTETLSDENKYFEGGKTVNIRFKNNVNNSNLTNLQKYIPLDIHALRALFFYISILVPVGYKLVL